MPCVCPAHALKARPELLGFPGHVAPALGVFVMAFKKKLADAAGTPMHGDAVHLGQRDDREARLGQGWDQWT